MMNYSFAVGALLSGDNLHSIYWGLAVFGSIFFGITCFLAIIGIGGLDDGMDVDADGAALDHVDHGFLDFNLFSIRSILAFLTVFGWGGVMWVDTLYVVILAQSIRDVGGNIPVLVDWDGTGFDAGVSNTAKAMFKAGYRRTIDGDAITGLTEPTLTKTYTANAIGTYDFGSDKITGETRLVATLVRDPVNRKWKVVRLQYVE